MGNNQHVKCSCKFLVPGKVKSLDVTSRTTTTLDITWQEPDIRSPCLVECYEVAYKRVDPEKSGILVAPLTNVITNATQISLSELEVGSEYNISVTALSGTVSGQSDTMSATTKHDPSKYAFAFVFLFTS